MILIPEIETVIICPPRTGSSTLRKVVRETYPASIQLYHHMEADGIPDGYDHWRRVGLVRNPIDRLWSLYKFMGAYTFDRHCPEFCRSLKASVGVPFDQWILSNEVVFSSPYDRSGSGRFFPLYTCRHALPENRKSQWVYLRPDLGTEVFPFARFVEFGEMLGLNLSIRKNGTRRGKPEDRFPLVSVEAMNFLQRCHRWDFQVTESSSMPAFQMRMATS